MLQLRLAGVPALLDQDGFAHALTARDALMLARVALAGPCDRDALCEALWPDAALLAARANLRQRLHRLKGLAGRPVVVHGPQLLLAPDVVHDAAALAGSGAVDPEAGDWLGGFEFDNLPALGDWVCALRVQWRALQCQAVAQAAVGHAEAGRFGPAQAAIGRWLQLAPDSEAAWRAAMRVQALQGDRAGALARYDERVRRLARIHGGEPEPETRVLADSLRSGLACTGALAALPVSVLRPPLLAGRETEWARLAAARQSGRSLLVLGEAGIGKTRLLQELAESFGVGLRVAALPADAGMPYAFAARWLQAMLPEPAAADLPDWATRALAPLHPACSAAPGTAPQSGRITAAVALLLPRWDVIWLDDLHFADRASTELLASLLEPEGRPAWWLAARSLDAHPVLAASLQAQAGAIETVQLGPLDADAVEQLLAGMRIDGLDAARWAPLLWRHTGGRPQFILETLKHHLAQRRPQELPTLGLPATVQATVVERCRRLQPQALALLRVAAVADADFDAGTASAVMQHPAVMLADAWHELESAQLLNPQGFVHALVADAVRQSLPAPIARALHAAVADRLARLPTAPARIAAHWVAAERWSEAGQQLRAAAAEARSLGRRAEEAEFLAQAADAFGRAGQADARIEALADRVGALVQADPGAHRAAADALLAEARTDMQRLLALLARSESFNAHGDLQANRAPLTEAMAIAERLGDLGAKAVAGRRLAYALVYTGDAAAAEAVLDGLEAQVEALPPPARAEFHADQGTVLGAAGRRRRAARVQTLAVGLSQTLGSGGDAVVGLCNLGTTLYQLGELDAAAARYEQAFALPFYAEQMSGIGATLQVTAGAIARDRGRHDQALALLQPALALCIDGGNRFWQVHAENSLALLWLALGQPGRALPLLAGDAQGLPGFIAAARGLVRAQAARALGRPAGPDLAAAWSRLQAADRAETRIRLLAEQALDSAPAEALAQADEIDVLAATHELDGLRQLARAHRALALHALGRVDEAGAHALELADALAKVQPLGGSTPWCWWVAARVLQDAGDPAGAGAAITQAARWLEQALHATDVRWHAGLVERQPVQLALGRLARQLGRPWPQARVPVGG